MKNSLKLNLIPAVSKTGTRVAFKTFHNCLPLPIIRYFYFLQVVASPSTCQGYNFAVDWWSLGVTAFELKSGGERPFDINQKTSVSTAIVIFEKSKTNPPQYSSSWSPEFTKFVAGLLSICPEKRTATLAMAKKTKVYQYFL